MYKFAPYYIEPGSILRDLFVFVVVGALLFLIFREIACWYWKINERIQLQKDMIHRLEMLNENLIRVLISDEIKMKQKEENDSDSLM